MSVTLKKGTACLTFEATVGSVSIRESSRLAVCAQSYAGREAMARRAYPALVSTRKHRLYPLGLSITGAVAIMNGRLGKASCASYPPAMRAPFVYRVTALCVFLMGFALHL